MDWIKSLFEVNDIYKPLIPLGIILFLVNVNGNPLVYFPAAVAVIVGIFGLFIKNRLTKLIAAILFATTGNLIVLSFLSPYISYFGIFGGILVLLLAGWIIFASLLVIYKAVINDDEWLDEETEEYYDGYVEEYYDENDEDYYED